MSGDFILPATLPQKGTADIMGPPWASVWEDL